MVVHEYSYSHCAGSTCTVLVLALLKPLSLDLVSAQRVVAGRRAVWGTGTIFPPCRIALGLPLGSALPLLRGPRPAPTSARALRVVQRRLGLGLELGFGLLRLGFGFEFG